jgi:tRNA-Thr(GGU) m(6)t(6)A37 methyltransferase TsaA
MSKQIEVQPVGVVRGPRTDPTDDGWGAVESEIVLDERFEEDALVGLAEFSHLEVLFLFHLTDPAATSTGKRYPRGLTHLPQVGIFAQRNRDRPNHIGLSRCELLLIEGRRLRVRGLDALDGTPVLDIKPWFPAFAPRPETVRTPPWVQEIIRRYY